MATNIATNVDELTIYRQEIETWRREREEALRAPEGWLSLAGLHLLENGEYTLGSAPQNAILLPASAPAKLGTLRYYSDAAMLTITSETPVLVNGLPVWAVEMVDNRHGQPPTVVRFGNLSLNLHKFGEQVALRVRDSGSPVIQNFAGCRWYAIKPEYRIVAKFVRQPQAIAIEVPTSVATVATYRTIGTIEFELGGESVRLVAAETAKDDELFIIFRDATAGQTTYAAGRYLYAALSASRSNPEGAEVVVDFNKAYNPPCAFTPFATCSLPPAENLLQVPIEAGELY
jgi:hypothetical protein